MSDLGSVPMNFEAYAREVGIGQLSIAVNNGGGQFRLSHEASQMCDIECYDAILGAFTYFFQ